MTTQTWEPAKPLEELFRLNAKLTAGLENLLDTDDIGLEPTPKELVYEEDRVKVFRYVPQVAKPHGVPILISYALVNKQYMLDLQADRSMIERMVASGLDVYIIDWGYPAGVDKFLTLEDYVDGYLNNIVDFIRTTHNLDKINLLGVCQGATMAACYTSMYQEKVNSFIGFVMPFDFSTDDGLLFKWSRHMDIDAMVDAHNNLYPGDSLNDAFNMLKPLELSLDKYVYFIDKMDNKDALLDFLRMEAWIYDSPDQAGPMLKRFIKDFYQENRFAEGTLQIGGRPADPKNITCPVLLVLGLKDHLVPPASTRPFIDAVSSSDKTLKEYPVGHIGVFVSSRVAGDTGPLIHDWVTSH
ncbi:MAG: class III poly(R)-hydroxyalkanoic acid synthase subunit PhaC [Propionibacteriaceae bacterium]|jgi:polyhydroxyalkanoate synthase|nr:class III poly(R)-hydroxyalkanoic acid synthase subunit PhaC [Propionibacteriaceae bacterium]